MNAPLLELIYLTNIKVLTLYLHMWQSAFLLLFKKIRLYNLVSAFVFQLYNHSSLNACINAASLVLKTGLHTARI